MKRKLNDLKLAAILILLALSNFAVEGYPTWADPACEDCEGDNDDWDYCDISIRFEPAWISVFAGETVTVNASCSYDDATWKAEAWDFGAGLLSSASASPGPARLSAVAIVTRNEITPPELIWGGRARYSEANVYVTASVSDEAGYCSYRHSGELFKVLGLLDHIDTLANISADPGGTGWLELQVTKRRYTSSPGEWTFSATLENPADSQFVTSLSAASTGQGKARVNYAAAQNITPPDWCDPNRPYCSIPIPVRVTAVRSGAGAVPVTETATISVLVRMPG